LKKIQIIFSLLVLFCITETKAQKVQPTWSISTDFGALRSQKEQQRFWTVGHTIKGEMHITKRTGPYAWVSYFFNGKFKNSLTAEAKSPSTSPQSFAFRNDAKMKLKEFSIGWKHYLKGSCDNYKTWNLYGMAGFGIIGGNIENTFNTPVDTALYNSPVLVGKSRFKRLTVDLGLGWEVPVTSDIFLYNDWKVWIPTSDYPSAYILSNRYIPLIASVHVGIRVYFE